MGKKPVVALGLLWAGMLAAGCGECCRNNNARNKNFAPSPALGAKATRTDRESSPIVPVNGTADKNAIPDAPAKPADLPQPLNPAAGAKTSAALPANAGAPRGVEALSPRSDGFSRQPADPALGRLGTEPARPAMMPPLPQTSKPAEAAHSTTPSFEPPPPPGIVTLPPVGTPPAPVAATTSAPPPPADPSLPPPVFNPAAPR